MVENSGELNNEELHTLYSLPSIVTKSKSWRKRWEGHVACMREKRNLYRIVAGKPEGKIPLEKSRHRWEGNVTINFREIPWDAMD
jgi:hypothetical protein